MDSSKDKQEMRVIIVKDTYRLLKKLAGIREISLSKLAQEAFDRYLEEDDTKEPIDRHKLENWSLTPTISLPVSEILFMRMKGLEPSRREDTRT